MSQAAEPMPTPAASGTPAPRPPIPAPPSQTGLIIGVISIIVAVLAFPALGCCYVSIPVMMTALGLALAAYLHPDRSGRITGIIGLVLGGMEFLLISAIVVFLLVTIAVESRKAKTARPTPPPVSTPSAAPAAGGQQPATPAESAE